jgi:hypothetical protein
MAGGLGERIGVTGGRQDRAGGRTLLGEAVRLVLVGLLALLTPWVFSVLAQAADASEPTAAPYQHSAPVDEASAEIEQFIYSRQCETRLLTLPGEPAVLPFRYPARPTLTVDICGESYDLLFDTGALGCLLQPRPGETLPGQLHYSGEPGRLAPLEAKRAYSEAGELRLNYALAPVMSCAQQLYLRDVPLRVYQPSANLDRDYSGAFAVVLLADYLVVVNNSARQIELYDRQAWQPPVGCVMLPLLLLPRGYFVPGWLAGEQYWFHFDTGFSGELGLTGELRERLADELLPCGESETYSGWHADSSFSMYTLGETLQLRPYPTEPWSAAAPLELVGLEALQYGDVYAELQGQGYRVGGILGSGVWQHYNYALDLRQQRLYILSAAE